MWAFILTYDHVISAACDIFCTCVMVVNIVKNRRRIDDLENEVCPMTGKEKPETK